MTVCVLLTMLHLAQPPVVPQGVAVALGGEGNSSITVSWERPPLLAAKWGHRGHQVQGVEKGLGGQAGQWREKVRIREEGT